MISDKDKYIRSYHECLHLFFFFQAEDGIRDGTVTGVQTCALPISPSWYAVIFFSLSLIARVRRSGPAMTRSIDRSEEHTSELQSQFHLVCRLLLEKKKKNITNNTRRISHQNTHNSYSTYFHS